MPRTDWARARPQVPGCQEEKEELEESRQRRPRLETTRPPTPYQNTRTVVPTLVVFLVMMDMRAERKAVVRAKTIPTMLVEGEESSDGR